MLNSALTLANPSRLHAADTSFPAATRHLRYRSLDFWRGVACLLVIIYHSVLVHKGQSDIRHGFGSDLIELASLGNIGVPMFFVISGYCIAASADSARRKNHDVRSFFVRRFRRIFPPYLIMVALLVAVHFILDYVFFPGILYSDPWPQLRPWWYSGWSWLGNLTLTETWREHLIGGPHAFYPGQNWSLCYEEQFYAVIGLSLFFFRRRLLSFQMVISVAVALIMVAASLWDFSIIGFFFDGRWFTFAAGITVYYVIHYSNPIKRLSLVMVILGLASWSWCYPRHIPGGFPAFCFALLLLILHRWDNYIGSAALLRPIAWCGTMCYSLYLVHQIPVKAVAQAFAWSGVTGTWSTLCIVMPICIALSILLGYVFFHCVERKFLNTSSSS